VAVGFSRIRQQHFAPVIRHLFGDPVEFLRHFSDHALASIPEGTRLVVWGLKTHALLDAAVRNKGLAIFRAEDGLLRSIGSQADLKRPMSVILDPVGLYLDPSRSCALDIFLNSHAFLPLEVERARALMQLIVRGGIFKYTFPARRTFRPLVPSGRRGVLIPLQFDEGWSVSRSGAGVKSLELVRQVRRQMPSAFIIVKTPPDLSFTARKVVFAACGRDADIVTNTLDLEGCLDAVEEVHTISSTTGFEALLRQKLVHVYGKPFYSGWGLTKDRQDVAQRRRTLSLEALVYGALVHYPAYFHHKGRELVRIEPETAVTELIEQVKQSQQSWWRSPISTGLRGAVRSWPGLQR